MGLFAFTEENVVEAKEVREISCDVLDHVRMSKNEHNKVDKSPGSNHVCPQTLWEAREEIVGAWQRYLCAR